MYRTGGPLVVANEKVCFVQGESHEAPARVDEGFVWLGCRVGSRPGSSQVCAVEAG